MKKRFKVVRASSGNKINKQVKAVFIAVLIIVAFAAIYLSLTSEEVLLAPGTGMSLPNAGSVLEAIGVPINKPSTDWFCSRGQRPFNTVTGEPVDANSYIQLKDALGVNNVKKLEKKHCGKTGKRLIPAPKSSPSPTVSP